MPIRAASRAAAVRDGDADLRQDRRHVVVDGPLGDEQPLGDLAVRQALRDQGKDLLLACGQPGRSRPVAGRGPRGIARTPAASSAAWPRPRRPGHQLIEHRSASLSPPSSEDPSLASAASYDRPSRSHAAAAPAQSPAVPRPWAPGDRVADRRTGRLATARWPARPRPRVEVPARRGVARPGLGGRFLGCRQPAAPPAPRARGRSTPARRCPRPATAPGQQLAGPRVAAATAIVPRTRSGFSRFTGEMPGWSSIACRCAPPHPSVQAAAAYEPASP